jgi:hypothetical protein
LQSPQFPSGDRMSATTENAFSSLILATTPRAQVAQAAQQLSHLPEQDCRRHHGHFQQPNQTFADALF